MAPIMARKLTSVVKAISQILGPHFFALKSDCIIISKTLGLESFSKKYILEY